MADQAEQTQGASPEQGSTSTEAPAAPSVDFTPLMEKFGQLEERMDQRFATLEQGGAPPEQEQAPDDPWAFLNGQQEEQDPEPAQQFDPAAWQQAIDKATDAKIAPLRQQMEDDRREAEANRLTEQYPALADPETAQQVVQTAIEAATRMRNPALAAEPAFIEQVYLAQRGREAAEQEVPAGGQQDAALETPGAGGAAGESDVPMSQQIIEAGRKNGSLWM